MKHSQKKFVAILFAVLLAAAVLIIAIGYAGDLTGTVVKDSPLPTPEEPPTDTPESPPPAPTDTPEPTPTDTPEVPPTDTPETPPTDTPEPPTATFTITPSETTAHRIRIEVRWYDTDNNVLGDPPADLPADFAITAESDLGDATCTYPAESTALSCSYSNDASAPDDSGLWISEGGSYTVSQTGLPAEWSSFGGIGTFPDSGFTTHIVHNRAPGKPAQSPTPTNTPPPAAPLEVTSTSTPEPPPTAAPPTDTLVPPTATFTPEPPTNTPAPPTATSTPEPPTPTDTVEPSTPPEATLTPVPTDTPISPEETSTSTPSSTPVAAAQGESGARSTSTPGPREDTSGTSVYFSVALGVGLGLILITLFLFLIRKKNSK